MALRAQKSVASVLRAGFLGASLAMAIPSYAQDKNETNILPFTAATNIANTSHDALAKFDLLVTTAVDLCKKHCETIETVDDIAEQVKDGFAVLNSDALVLDQGIIDRINEDAERLRKLRGTAPKFNIITPEQEAILNGDDDAARQEVYKKITSARNEYQKKYERWLEKRANATVIYDDAEAAYQRVIQLDRKLENLISNSPAVFLTYFYRFDHLLVDVKIPLTDAIVRRASAASDLKKDYDRAISEMKANLRRTEPLQQWINFTQWQDAFRPETKLEINSVDDVLFGPPIGGNNELQEARAIINNIKNTDIPTEQQQFIKQALDIMRISNQQVREAVAKLLQEAGDADAEATRAQFITGVLTQGAAVAGSAWQSSGTAVGANDPSVHYNYTTTGWGTNPDGTPYFYRHSIEGNITPLPLNNGNGVTIPQPK